MALVTVDDIIKFIRVKIAFSCRDKCRKYFYQTQKSFHIFYSIISVDQFLNILVLHLLSKNSISSLLIVEIKLILLNGFQTILKNLFFNLNLSPISKYFVVTSKHKEN